MTLMGDCVGGGEPVPKQEFVDNDGWPFANFSRTKRLVKFLEVKISVKQFNIPLTSVNLLFN